MLCIVLIGKEERIMMMAEIKLILLNNGIDIEDFVYFIENILYKKSNN